MWVKICAYFTTANLIVSAFLCYKIGTHEVTLTNLNKTLSDVVAFCNDIGPKVNVLTQKKDQK